MRRNKKNKSIAPIIKILLSFLVFVLFLALLVLGLRSYIMNALYFRIKKVTFVGLEDRSAVDKLSKELIYDNIFSLNINKIKEDLMIANPQFYDVEVARKLPDELIIKIVQRKPLAQIQQRGFFLVDSEGVVVSNMSRKAFAEFIVISGLKGISSLSFGKKINSKELRSGIRLAQALSDIKEKLISLLPKEITKIDLYRYPSLYVYRGDLELRLYDDDLGKQLRVFKDILPSLEKKIKQVQYIDLRFTDPVVSFKK